MNVWVNDTNSTTNFYDFPVQMNRYRAITLQPGDLTEGPEGTGTNAFDFDKMKITVAHLRNKTIE